MNSTCVVKSSIFHFRICKDKSLAKLGGLVFRPKCFRVKNECISRPLSTNERKEETKSNAKIYDIVVSGGGLVGSAMACSLGDSVYFKDKKILLLEGGSPITYRKQLPEKYSNRVSAISPGSTHLLSELGVWDHILRTSAVKSMQVWDALSPSSISFQDSQMEKNVFHIVENNLLLGALSERLRELNADVMYKVKVTKYLLPKAPQDIVSLQLQDGTWIKTKLLVGADGFNSLVRRAMDVHYVSWNYNQHAIVGNLRLAEAVENNIAFQKFLPTGPIAILPLSSEVSSLVWTVTPSMAEKLMKLPDDRFIDELNSALWDATKPHPVVQSVSEAVRSCLDMFLPKFGSMVQLPPSILEVEPESRAAFPLGLGHASNYVKPRCALIGDAAHRVHPLAGLGVNLGFGDVKSLTEVLENSVRNGCQIGLLDSLSEYETERQRRNVPIMAAIDGLNRLYSTSFVPLVALRSMGLQMVDAAKPLKKFFLKMASY